MRIAVPLLQADEVRNWQDLLARSDWRAGSETAGWLARTVKHNQQALLEPSVREALRIRILEHPVVRSAALPAQGSLPLCSRYESGMAYGSHSDDAQIGGVRTDLAYTLFLSDPTHYSGGELVLEDLLGDQALKLPAGSLLLYDCGVPHRVAPVTQGVRLAAVGWIQSRVADAALRADLFELERVRQMLRDQPAATDALQGLSLVYNRLLRRGTG